MPHLQQTCEDGRQGVRQESRQGTRKQLRLLTGCLQRKQQACNHQVQHLWQHVPTDTFKPP